MSEQFGAGDDRDEERLRRALHTGPVEPLAPEAGHYDRIVGHARHRRQRRWASIAGVFVLVAGIGVGIGAWGGSTDSLSQRPSGSGGRSPTATATASSTTSPSASALAAPSPQGSANPSTGASPSASTGGNDGAGSSGGSTTPDGLPTGGPVPPKFATTSVTSVGGGVTYVLGMAPCSNTPCTSMARTTDGGAHWVGIRPPRVDLATDGSTPAGAVSGVRFANSRDGWLFGGALYATHDGAGSWHKLSIGAGTVQQVATDGSQAYALVGSCSDSAACTGLRLYSTAVASDSWQPVSGVAGSGSLGAISLGRSATVSIGNEIWVRSGSGWSRAVSVRCGAGLSGVAAAADDSSVHAFCGEGAAGSLYLMPYTSTDSGRSWHAAATNGTALRLHSGQLSVTAASANVLAATTGGSGLGGGVAVSRDGGATWATASLPAGSSGWRYVGAAGGNQIDAISEGGTLYMSSDAGRSWSVVAIAR